MGLSTLSLRSMLSWQRTILTEHLTTDTINSKSLLTERTRTNLLKSSRKKSIFKRTEQRLLTSKPIQQSVPTSSILKLQTSSTDGELIKNPLISQLTIRLVQVLQLMLIFLEVFILRPSVMATQREEETSVFWPRKEMNKCSS